LRARSAHARTHSPATPIPAWQSATILDSISGAPAAFHATLIAESQHTHDSVTFDDQYHGSGDSTLAVIGSGSGDQRGAYDVRVREAGYQLWQQRDIRISGDACGAGTPVLLTARLQRTR
jgi:hypothetical protein